MNKKILISWLFAFGSISLLLSSCSKSERIPEATVTLNASFSFTGTETWPERYEVELGTFGTDSINPLKYKTISSQSENVTASVVLTDLPASASMVKLYLANSAHQPVYSFFRETINTANETELTIPQQSIEMIKFARVQAQVFSNCIVCHGGSSGGPAAGMSLMPGVSYANLVNHITANSVKKRIEPGSINNSFMIDVLRKKQSVFVHSASNTIAEEDIQIIEHWIDAGAPNN